MARKPTKFIDISGLTIDDILKMNITDFRGVSTANVKSVTSRLVSAMNKRIKRLGQTELGRMSPTYKAFEKRGKYSVRGLTRESTFQVFQNLKESFGKSTSLTEWKKEHKEILQKLHLDFDGDIDTEKKFWDLYHDYAEEDKRVSNLKGISGDAINIIYKKFMVSKKTGKELSRRGIKASITRAYNKKMAEKIKNNKHKSTASVFEDMGN